MHVADRRWNGIACRPYSRIAGLGNRRAETKVFELRKVIYAGTEFVTSIEDPRHRRSAARCGRDAVRHAPNVLGSGGLGGPKFKGTVLCGMDQKIFRADVAMNPNVHLILKTDDDALIYIYYTGV